jgi:hypothetical protein
MAEALIIKVIYGKRYRTPLIHPLKSEVGKGDVGKGVGYL